MTRARIVVRALGLALLVVVAHPAQAQESAVLLQQARQGTHYVRPARSELLEVEALFARTLSGEEGAALAADWQAHGFELQPLKEGDGTLLVLRECPEARRGRGFYLLRRGGPGGLVWQAPHSFRDEGTGTLVLQLMLEGRALAATWNTVPRDLLGAGESDLAHAEQSYLTAFSRAVLGVRSQTRVVQLHGFAKSKRSSPAGAAADLILSSGERQPGPQLSSLGACLQQVLPLPVRLYPSQVRELGGTSNRIGQLLRAGGSQGFVHMEMSPAMRSLLKTDPASRRAFAACLGDQP